MNNNTRTIYISEMILTLAVLILLSQIDSIDYMFKNSCAIISLTIMLMVLIVSFGIKKDNNYLKGGSTRTLIALLMSYMLVIYGLGIFLGFNKGYLLNSSSYYKNVMSVVLFNSMLEATRYLVAKNCFKTKGPLIVFTVLSILINILLQINLGNLTTFEDMFIFLSTVIFPIIAEEILCSFITYKISMLPSIIYKLVMKLYIFIMPIVPDLGDYIYSCVNVAFPFIIYIIFNKMIIRYEREKQRLKQRNILIVTIPLLLILVILVILVSGIFRYKMIAIGSDSMVPIYHRGDAVIYEKIKIDSLEIGDILVFQKEDIIVTHRIVKIWIQDGKYHFVTKGDNNNTKDSFIPTEKDVLGRVRATFKYIGYPTVKINEFFGKE